MGKLHDRMLQYMELRGFSQHTIDVYMGHAVRYVRHLGRSPETAGAEEIRKYLHYLIKDRGLSPGTVNQACSSLKFFYVVIFWVRPGMKAFRALFAAGSCPWC